MAEILSKEWLSPGIKQFTIHAPLVAKHVQPGEFVILRISGTGAGIPLSIADFDRGCGTITVIVQEMGAATRQLVALKAGDRIADCIGPLSRPVHIGRLGTVVLAGGGIGVAAIYPVARAMRDAGNRIVSIIGARSRDMLICREKIASVSDALFITTDDGTYGRRGFVTDMLKDVILSDAPIAEVVAIGPLGMMRAVAEMTRPYCIRTVVSLSPLLASNIEGREFNAHTIDFTALIARQRLYLEQEKFAGS